MTTLDLGIVGNCCIGALIDGKGRIVWCCFPRFDSDPVFCDLLNDDADSWFFAIELDGFARAEQEYLSNTAILITRLYNESGAGIEITDYAPRFTRAGRRARPTTLVRMVRPIGGTPRIIVRLRPVFSYGASEPQVIHGSNHIRYAHSALSLRLTTDLPIVYILEERPFLLRGPAALIFGPDETLGTSVFEAAREWHDWTAEYWKVWVRGLSIPFEWQDAVIRSAITLKLCSFESTGAIVAALTTSIPEAAGTQRNWDYRYCWLRDAYFTVQALNSVSAHQTMEDHLLFLENIVADSTDGRLQPVYGIALERHLDEEIVTNLPGYRGMGPVRRGNQAFEHDQHDAYGEVILAATQAFFDLRLLSPADESMFDRLEPLGEQAFQLHDQPDAGIWEFRNISQVHTFSSVMCWAACDRLANIASHLGLPERPEYWRKKAKKIKQLILEKAWNPRLDSFVLEFDGEDVDACLLLLAEVGFVSPQDQRFHGTVRAVEKSLVRGYHLFRYARPDDFGAPSTAFNVCTFWYINALWSVGRIEEAREWFVNILSCCNPLGLLSEDLDPETGEFWGNFPQTYSHVGLINCAWRLSLTWNEAISTASEE